MIKQRDQHTSFPVTISRFRAGLATNRDPLHTPLRVQALSVIPLYDALIDGLNVEVSPRDTLVRRPGFPQFCSVAITGTPLAFSSFKRTGSSPYLILDTTTGVYQFTTSAINSVYSKSTTAQTSFQQAGSFLYCADGTSAKKVDSSLAVTNWGIVAPTAAPNVANVAASSLPAWAANTFYSTSLLLLDSNGNLQLLTTSGTTGGSEPVWATSVGSTTTDNTAVWTCQGTATRATNHAYALGAYIAVSYNTSYTYYTLDPHTGARIPHTTTVAHYDFFKCTTAGTSSSTATGSITWPSGTGSQLTDGTVVWTNTGTKIGWSTIGAATLVSTNTYIVDSNGNQQTVTTTGKSGGSSPTFSTVLGQNTADSGTGWINAGPLAAANTLPWQYVYVYRNSTTGHISSASPVSNEIFLAATSYIAVSGTGSSDTQVTNVDVYRTKQGGSVYYYLDTVTNPGAAAFTYTDTFNDSLLNTEQLVTTVPLNDPPPSGTKLIAFYQGRLWVTSGRNLYFDGGGDIINGVAHECFPPANVFPYLSDIKALVPTSQGLLVFLEDEIHVILGGPQTLTYFSQTVMQGVGVKSQNAVQQDHDNVYFLSSQGQGFLLSSDGFGEFGLAVADTLASKFSPSTSYLAKHRNGQDLGIFLSDGSTNIMRYNPTGEAWNPLAQPIGGCGPIASLETSTAVFSLLTTIGGHICARSLTNFLDGASTYTAYGTIGSIEVGALAAETAEVSHIITRLKNVGSRAAISVLPNSTSGTFVSVPFQTTLPAPLRGTPLESTSVLQNRHDLSGATGVAYNQINHLQVKVSWPSENAANELTALVIR